MKNLLLLLCVFAMISCNDASMADSSPEAKAALSFKEGGDKIPWVKIEDLEFLVKKEPRKVIVDAYTAWCGPCKMMDKNTFTDQNVINNMGKNFYAVKFDAESPNEINFWGKTFANPNYKPNRRRNSAHQLSRALGVTAYPTLVVLNENLEVIDQIRGYRPGPQLLAELNKHL